MDYTGNSTGTHPKYVELFRLLKDDIASGKYPPGSFLPTETELMDAYNMSKTTVRHAIKLLKERHLVEVRQGSGTKILGATEQEIVLPKYDAEGKSSSVSMEYTAKESASITMSVAAIDTVNASEECARALKLSPKSTVWRLQRLQRIDGQVCGYVVNYLDQSRFPDLQKKGELVLDLYGFLQKHYKTAVFESDETISAVSAGFQESLYLQVEMGEPLFMLRRSVLDVNHRPVEYCETIMRPDYVQFLIHTDYQKYLSEK